MKTNNLGNGGGAIAPFKYALIEPGPLKFIMCKGPPNKQPKLQNI